MQIINLLLSFFSTDKRIDLLHWTWTIEGINSN